MYKSIKGKLILWFSIVLAVFLSGSAWYLHNRLDKIVLRSTDNLLHSKSQLIQGLIEVDELHIEIELSEVAAGEYALPRSGHYYRILNWNAKEIVRSPSLENSTAFPEVSLPLYESEHFLTIENGPAGEPVRWITSVFKSESGFLVVQAGDRLTEGYRMVHDFGRILLLAAPLGLLILVVGAIAIVNISLVPLAGLSDRIGRITHKNLNERLNPTMQDRELRELALSFNDMLDKLERAFEQEQRFVSDASHELKTPVTVIKSQCDVILRKDRTAQEYRDSLLMIQTVAGKMRELVESLLAVAQLDTSVPIASNEPVSVSDVVKTSVHIIRPIAVEHHVTLQYGELAEDAWIMGDQTRLTEVIVNLVENGVRYNKPGGSVDVEVHTGNGEVAISVRDTGVGIAPENIDQVFKRFWREDKSRSTGGSGLGLSIVKRIVEAHDGRVEVTSTPGEGSCFTVYLPLQATPPEAPAG